MRVLVTYATKNGSTTGIAEAVGDELRKKGLQVDVVPAAEVRDLTPYDAVVLGSAIYMGRWQKDALRFGKRHGRELQARPVWLFGSGPLDRSAEEQEIPPVEGAAELMARIGARGHATFGGRLTEEASGFIASSMVKNGKGGDFRNMDRIRAWAGTIAAELQGRPLVEAH